MDSRITIALAGVLLLGAVLAGYWGIALSRQPAPDAPQTSPLSSSADAAGITRTAVVVAARELTPFVPVTRDDLAVENLLVAPTGSFPRVEDVIGRIPWNPVARGNWLSEGSFAAGGPLARMIGRHERALAIAVDEVIGSGGHARPGDYVDVLLYMREEGAGQVQTAQVVVPALRLLSYGQLLGPDRDGKTIGVDADERDGRRSAARSVVLAVPEAWVTRLMLASQAGSLRLAVRSSEEHALRLAQADGLAEQPIDERTRNVLRLDQLNARPAAAPVPTVRAATVAQAPRVEVVRGGTSTLETP